MDGSNISIVIPINPHAGDRLQILMNLYQSIENIELILVSHSFRSSENLMNNVIWVIDEPWTEVYEAHAIGARYLTRDIILFLNVNQIISIATIEKFLDPLLTGKADAALNDMDYEFHKKRCLIPSKIFPQLTNHFINQPDLKLDTIMYLPYALTKQAIELIGGAETLVNPVLTHVRLNQKGFKLTHDIPIRNIFNLHEHEMESAKEQKIMDDYLQAYAHCFNGLTHAGFFDGGRRLDLLSGLLSGNPTSMPVIKSNHYYQPYARLSIIIPVRNEEKRIKDILEECKRLNPLEMIVVVNQSSDRTASIAYESGAAIIEYNERLGLDTGRAVGAYYASGDILLFIDGDFLIPADDLKPFVEAVERGVDVALNDQNLYLNKPRPLHPVTLCKYALNLACQRSDLGLGSTVAVPHAYSRKCIDVIGLESLANPALSYLKSLLYGFVVENVHYVNVNKMNRFRPASHYSNQKGKLAPATSLIVGDHLKALTHLGQVRRVEKGEKIDDA